MLVVAVVALVVSVGALAVAIHSAVSSRRSADSAHRAQADALGPSVTVLEPKPLRERWNYSPQGLPDSHLGYPPGEALVDKRFTRPMHNDVRILLGAHTLFVNEGSGTATILIQAFRVDRCDNIEDASAVLLPRAELPSPRIADGQLVLAPGERAGVVVRQGPTLAEWLQQGGDVPYVVGISAVASPDGSSQHWRLDLVAETLGAVYGNDAEFRVLAHVLPEVRLTPLPRTYPRRPPRGLLFWRS
ncbi:MAG TPA: hypothetical protein VFA11_12030 [Acidimicrobiales bacterium]|nr:hypothetical protein [Acidimicrobiales bacterium]